LNDQPAGKVVFVLSCVGCQQKGKSVCKGRHIPAATLDEIVLVNLKQHVLAPDRIADLLKSLMERQAAKSESADLRLLTLQREVSDADDRLRRLYRSIEDGVVEIDDILRERTASLKSERERAKAALDRARAQCGTVAAIDAQKIDAFARLMTDKLDNGDTNARKGYIRSIIDAVEVDDEAVRIIGSKDVLQAVIAGKQIANGNVRGFVRKWRSLGESNPCFSLERPKSVRSMIILKRSTAIETFRCQSRLVCTRRHDRTRFALETTQPKRKEHSPRRSRPRVRPSLRTFLEPERSCRCRGSYAVACDCNLSSLIGISY
jgi:hypothetical protein